MVRKYRACVGIERDGVMYSYEDYAAKFGSGIAVVADYSAAPVATKESNEMATTMTRKNAPVDLAKFEAWARQRGLDQKFTEEEVRYGKLSARLFRVAEAYAEAYEGDFEFMRDMKLRYITTGTLTAGQVKGILNCYLAELRRTRTAAPAASAPVATPVMAAPAVPALTIPNGTYTVVFSEADDDRITVKVSEAKFGDFNDGRQLVAHLSGPDNETDFQGIAFLVNGSFRPWNRFKGQSVADRVSKALHVIAGSGDPQTFGMAYALASGRCSRCNRKLTVPASIHRGLGPICARGGSETDN